MGGGGGQEGVYVDIYKDRVKQDVYNGVALVIGSGVWGIRKHICGISICCCHVMFLLLCARI